MIFESGATSVLAFTDTAVSARYTAVSTVLAFIQSGTGLFDLNRTFNSDELVFVQSATLRFKNRIPKPNKGLVRRMMSMSLNPVAEVHSTLEFTSEASIPVANESEQLTFTGEATCQL